MNTETSKTTCMVSPAEISQIGEDAGVYKASKKQILSFFSAIPAGAFYCVSVRFFIPQHKQAISGLRGA